MPTAIADSTRVAWFYHYAHDQPEQRQWQRGCSQQRAEAHERMIASHVIAMAGLLLSLRSQLRPDSEADGTAVSLAPGIRPMPGAQQQTLVNAHFARAARYWKDIYQAQDVYGYIHQQRSAVVLEWIDALRLPANARVLEVGCGTGLTSIALARRGFLVDAMDSVAAMIDLAQQHVTEAALDDRIACAVGDCHKLQYGSGSCDAVVAMGVTPFLHSLPLALREMARVLKPGGWLLVNADNRRRLTNLIDPWLTPAGARVRRFIHRGARPAFVARMYTRREFDRMLADAGLEVARRRMLGFGPFTLFGRLLLPDRAGIRLHLRLQQCADGGAPLLRVTGAQYLVMARKAPLV